jgi:integrase
MEHAANVQPPQNPFIDPKGMMMAEVLVQLDQLELTDTQRRDLKSAVRTLCRLIDRAVEEVPANINWVFVRLRRVHPAQAGISKKHLSNVKSSVIKALELVGASRARADWLRKPSPAWEALFLKVPSQHDVWKLTQLAQYCCGLDVEPEAVTSEHIRRLLEALKAETFINKPHAKVNAMVTVWNKLARDLDGWPKTHLVYPRRKETWTIKLEAFPVSFLADVDRLMARLTNPDPLTGDGPAKPLRPASLFHRRFQIQEFASAVVLSGVPIEEIVDLASIVQYDRFKNAIRFLMARFGNQITGNIASIATGMKSIARHHVKLPPKEMEELQALCKRIAGGVERKDSKNKERLEQLEDENNLRLLLMLPTRLAQIAAKGERSERRRALLIQAALAIEILLHAPMRIGNLSRINIDRHIRRVTVKGRDCLLISIPGEEVKNGRDLAYELTNEAVKLYDLYLGHYRPTLMVAPSDHLFPAQDGGPKRPHTLSSLITVTIKAETGLVIHPHLFRSIAGKIHLMVNPGDFGTVSHAIGDTIATTMKAYAQHEQKNAVRHYQASVEAVRSQLTQGGARG